MVSTSAGRASVSGMSMRPTPAISVHGELHGGGGGGGGPDENVRYKVNFKTEQIYTNELLQSLNLYIGLSLRFVTVTDT